MIYIRTYAYNAEKTLRRAVDSVLNQTHSDFVFYLCDNGSTDGTRKIVEEYASRDSRIKAFYNTVNHAHQETEECRFLPYNIKEDDFYCTLDADDEYLPTFLEEMLAFIDEYNLDIAACGSDFFSVADNNKLVSRRLLTQNLILQGNGFDDCFSIYYQFFRTTWGKLYTGWTMRNTVQNTNNAPNFPRAYGGDTYNTMRAFRDAERVGIFAKSLHKYYMSAKSVSYVMHPERVKSDQILHEAALDYLKPYGKISPRNEKFLYLVYFNAIKDTLNVIINAQIPPLEKMRSIQEVFICEYTRELFRQNYADVADELNKLRAAVLKWTLAQKECRRDEGSDICAEILVAMHGNLPQTVSRDGLKYIISKMPEMIEYLLQKDYNRILERLRTWFKRHDADIPALTELEISTCHALSKPDDEIFMLLTDIRKNRPQASKALDIDVQICKLIEKYPLLKNMSSNLAATSPQAICWVMKGNYKKALDAFISVKNVKLKNDTAKEVYILFGQNISAAAENTDAYIYFKKAWISYLLDCSRVEEAGKELDQFEQNSPDDKDFIELRRRWNSNILSG